MNVCIHTYMYLSYTGTKAEVDILQEKFSKGEWRPPFRVEEDCSDTESTPVALVLQANQPTIKPSSSSKSSATKNGKLHCTVTALIQYTFHALLVYTKLY